jgi:hypothetical protein
MSVLMYTFSSFIFIFMLPNSTGGPVVINKSFSSSGTFSEKDDNSVSRQLLLYMVVLNFPEHELKFQFAGRRLVLNTLPQQLPVLVWVLVLVLVLV